MRACRLDSRCSIFLIVVAGASVLGSPVVRAADRQRPQGSPRARKRMLGPGQPAQLNPRRR
jgi:hypothetical protein